ncbi:ABC transporter substrate-binding protein [Arcobacter sp. LA11]|uniref:ABC transporter substrate-binding protein n=1 Tax=Arcobacter sp. LA11 TaxID=1898176 RepID=UPI0009336016|nr:ABC transporter substrate-binding protein [Arcobacter sp. LA11]
MGSLIKIIFIFLLLIISSYSQNLNKVTLQLQWLNQFQFAGYYIAKEKGFYKDLGLEVEILPYKSNTDILKNVVSKKVDFATGRTSLLVHKNNGYEIVALAAIFQQSPAALLVTNDKINSPYDLKNKRIMISADAITSASYMAMLFSEGVMSESILIQKHSYNLDDLINGKTDAIASYISNEPHSLKKRGVKYKFFHPKDYGFDFYGDILYTSKQLLKNDPKTVESFTNASLKGWTYAFDNINKTAKIIFEKYNTQNKTLDELIFEGETLKKLAYDKNKEIGHISEEKFSEIAKVYRVLGLIRKDYKLDDFIHCIHCTRELKLTKEESDWLEKNKTIKLGTNKEWNPIEFFDNNGIYSGIAAGYLNLIEEKLEIKLQVEENAYWHEMIEKIRNQKLDMFLAIVNTPNRNKYMNFTNSYLQFPTVIVTRDDIGYIKNLKQLSNKKIAVERNFYTHELIKKYNEEINLIPVNTTKEALEKVYNGLAYAYIGALPNTGHFIKELKYTNLKINGEAPFKTNLSFSTRKDLTILNSILEKTLNSITQEEHDEIYNKWINIKYEPRSDYKLLSIISIIILLILIAFYYRNKSLKTITETDTLTKIANRRKLDSFLEIEMERSIRNNFTLSIAMIDIDFFKKINDTYGHKIGDEVLIKLSHVLNKHIRKYDLVGRWGGEEFLIVCPNSDLIQIISLCKKLQELIAKIKIKKQKDINITVSCGIAQYSKNESIDDFIYRADTELYKAKNNGRNCIYPLI